MNGSRMMGLMAVAHHHNKQPLPHPSATKREHKHSINNYRNGDGRNCPDCRALHNEAAKTWRAKRKTGEYQRQREEREARYAKALAFLKDGASYREASTSARVDEKQLAVRYPEYHGNAREWRSVLSSIKNNDQLMEMHREIWQKGAA